MAAEFKIVEKQTKKEYELSGSQDQDFVISWIDISDELAFPIAESLISISVSYSMDLCPQITLQLFDPEFRMLKSNYFNIGQNILFKSSTPEIYENFGPDVPVGPTGQMSDHPSGPTFALDKVGKEKTKYIGWVTQVYEVASVSVAPGSGASPSITVEARTKAIQQMKRDKKPSSIKGEGHVYVSQAAGEYNLKSFVQKTSKSKQISKGGTDKQADSLWDVLSNLASSAKFSLFEANGILFFASSQYIYGLWGPEHNPSADIFNPKTNVFDMKAMNYWYVHWPAIPQGWYPTQKKIDFYESYNATIPGALPGSPRWLFDDDTGDIFSAVKYPEALIPLSMPTFRRSDNDIYEVEGSLTLDRTNGIFLRPGMTIYVDGIPTFNDYYLITEVSYPHMSTDPVQITFRKPEREAKYITQIPVGEAANTNVLL